MTRKPATPITTKPAATTTDQEQWSVRLLGVPEVAKRLGIGNTLCWSLIRDKKLPVLRINTRTLVSEQALAAFVQSLSA